jgi:protein ImuB
VLTDPLPVEMIGDDDQPLVVSARGMLSSAPVALRWLSGDETAGWRPGAPQMIRSWAGPWPVEERWWEPQRARRLARFQVVTDDGQAYLVVAEHRRWWVSALYD